MESVTSTDTRTTRGRSLYFVGWAMFMLSVVLATSLKSSEPQSGAPFWMVFGLLIAVSFVYCIGCLVSPKWRAKTVRRYFSPYLLGSVGWLTLFLVFWLLDRYAG